MTRLMIIGGSHPTAVGNSLLRAAQQRADVTTHYVNYDEAFEAPRWLRAACWHLLEKRPPRLRQFNQRLITQCLTWKPDLVVCAGNTVLSAPTLKALQSFGTRVAIFLTDDPWNQAHASRRFMQTLPDYDLRLSPRRRMMNDLERVAPEGNAYLPFGYDPEFFYLHQPIEPPLTKSRCEVLFAGGADTDRVPLMEALLSHGTDLHLYGDLWSRWQATASAFQGYAQPQDLARMIAESTLSLCLVRRANRDGQCMRTYELPAAGACILMEDTEEHRELFGEDDVAVRYFRTTTELLTQTDALLGAPEQRQRLRAAAHRLITCGRHSYADRLHSILHMVASLPPAR